MSGFQPAGRRWLLRGFSLGLPLSGSPPTHRRVGLSQGLPIQLPKHLLGTNTHLPRTWPLARLTIPLEGLSKQIDRLLEGYCFQILATNRYPEAHNGKVLQTATHLTWILAEYLSDTIEYCVAHAKYTGP